MRRNKIKIITERHRAKIATGRPFNFLLFLIPTIDKIKPTNIANKDTNIIITSIRLGMGIRAVGPGPEITRKGKATLIITKTKL